MFKWFWTILSLGAPDLGNNRIFVLLNIVNWQMAPYKRTDDEVFIEWSLKRIFYPDLDFLNLSPWVEDAAFWTVYFRKEIENIYHCCHYTPVGVFRFTLSQFGDG